MSIILSIYTYIHLFICPSLCLFICPSFCLFVHPHLLSIVLCSVSIPIILSSLHHLLSSTHFTCQWMSKLCFHWKNRCTEPRSLFPTAVTFQRSCIDVLDTAVLQCVFTSVLLNYIWRRVAETHGGLMQPSCRVWLETPHTLCIVCFLTHSQSFPDLTRTRWTVFRGGLNHLTGKDDNKHLVLPPFASFRFPLCLIQLLLVLDSFGEVEGRRHRSLCCHTSTG